MVADFPEQYDGREMVDTRSGRQCGARHEASSIAVNGLLTRTRLAEDNALNFRWQVSVDVNILSTSNNKFFVLTIIFHEQKCNWLKVANNM
jgi:hypothetical protein